jgi:hypothetical protein
MGVTDIPYSWGQTQKKGISAAKAMRAARSKTPPAVSGVTTGDVAEWLEAKYGVMAAYLVIREREIGGAVENSLLGAMETVMMGGPKGAPLATATSEMEHLFKDALSMRMFDGRLSGVPTAASLRGVSHRFKRAYVRRAPRPSFIDTGLYQSSFRVWVT